MSLHKSSIIVALCTLCSRIFGFIRDIFLAKFLGTGMVAEVFTLAFKLPNFFRTIFAEGALSASLVPIISSNFYNKEEKKTVFINEVTSFFCILLVLLLLIVIIFMPNIMAVLAPGFKNDAEKFSLCITIGRITFPYIFFISIATIFTCVLNTIGKFAIASLMPAILSFMMVIFLYIGTNLFSIEKFSAYSLSFGVLAGGFFQLVLTWYSLKKYNIIIKITYPTFSKELKLVLKNMLPGVIGAGVVQLNLWVGTIIASTIPGAVAILYYAERLNQLPLSIIGIALSTVLLPLISQELSNNNSDQANLLQKKAIRIAILFSIPCALGLYLHAKLIILVLFQRSEFSAEDTFHVSSALQALAIGLPAFIMNKIFSTRFFAMKDTITPVKVSLITVIINLLFCIYLSKKYSYLGVAIASVISAWFNVCMLGMILYIKKSLRLDLKFVLYIVQILVASIFMYLFGNYIGRSMISDGLIKLLLIIFGSIIIYFLMLLIFKIEELKEFTKIILKIKK